MARSTQVRSIVHRAPSPVEDLRAARDGARQVQLGELCPAGPAARRWPSALERENGNRTIERPWANCSYPSRTAPAGLAHQRLERAARGGHQRIELVEPNPASCLARPGERPKPS